LAKNLVAESGKMDILGKLQLGEAGGGGGVKVNDGDAGDTGKHQAGGRTVHGFFSFVIIELKRPGTEFRSLFEHLDMAIPKCGNGAAAVGSTDVLVRFDYVVVRPQEVATADGDGACRVTHPHEALGLL
tara:strand:+ start:604 stop:990 length:387 start_codon:yes stop_codon:yes gene_type:complete